MAKNLFNRFEIYIILIALIRWLNLIPWIQVTQQLH